MTSPRKPWTEQDHDEATSKADDLGMKLYGLTQVVKLAAFAAEARKALVSLDAAFEHRPKVRDDLHNHAHLANWSEMPDASSDALQFIAQELEQANEEFTNLSYRLATRLREHEQAQAGGRAS